MVNESRNLRVKFEMGEYEESESPSWVQKS